MAALSRILIVNDSRSFAKMAAHVLEQRLRLPIHMAATLADADVVLRDYRHERVLVITGLTLADGSGPQVVKHFTDQGRPVIVVTAMFDEDTRNRILALPVVDYVVKDSPFCMDHLVNMTRALERNRHHTALVVEDSRTMRQQTSTLLSLLGFHVIEAENGAEGLALLTAHPHITLVVTDYDMPVMDGLEMTRRIRQTHPREKLAIISMSAQISSAPGFLLSPRFLKCGANDFVHKPYLREEFQCRVEHNMEALESYAHLRDMATKDYLTGLWNRRHFFATAPSLMQNGGTVSVAMLDIDFFKRINDTHGHDAGDITLRSVARALAGCVRGNDLLARFGGEEFCLLSCGLSPDDAVGFYERLRQTVEQTPIQVDGATLNVTISIGAANTPHQSLEHLIAMADEALYSSKVGGRNRVSFHTPAASRQV